MAGGHNIVKSAKLRIKHRFNHKLVHYPKKYGAPGCTGCGRCSTSCLGKIGMKELLEELSKEVQGNA